MTTTSESIEGTGRFTAPRRGVVGAVIVAIAVAWQGAGTAVVGTTVPAQLSTFATFVAFLAAALLSLAGRTLVRRRDPALAPPRQIRRGDVVMLNLVTAGAFSTFYVAATLVPPTAASVLETGIGPLAIAVVAVTGSQARTGTLRQPAVVAGICLVVAALSLSTSELTRGPGETALGIALCVVAGCCAVGVLLSSHRLSGQGFGALEIAAARFHLAWILSGVLAVPALLGATEQTRDALGVTALTAVACIAAPILLLQWGITLCPPLPSALILAMLPAVVLAVESVLGGGGQPMVAVSMGLLVLVSSVGVVRGR